MIEGDHATVHGSNDGRDGDAGAEKGFASHDVARTDATLRIPRATYRVQLHAGFRFCDAMAIVPYLAKLGVSHVYCSPYLRARPGSKHGYDIVDHQSLNPEIGTREDLDAFVACLHAHGMGQIIDVVPNHMGIMGADNAWWLDVLESGQASAFADYFDIDWQPADADLLNRVLVPVLGDHYGAVLERGELTLAFDAVCGQFSVHYFNHRFPVDAHEYPRILGIALGAATIAPAPADAVAELKALVSAFGGLPHRDGLTPAQAAQRSEAKENLKRRLAALVRSDQSIGLAVEGALRSFNGAAGNAASFDFLHELLEAQAYRLAYWRVASDEINYRRFFDINELAALRMESEPVFEATHKLVFELVAAGMVDALRIDHPDGLYDPAAYFQRLQDRLRSLTSAQEAGAVQPVYVSVEKIIAPFEAMPQSWAVSGTTGYRFANVVNGLFVDTGAEARFTRLYRAFVGDQSSFADIAQRSKRVILRDALASELTVLTNRLVRIARADRHTRDYTLNTLRRALTEVIAAFPVYRTYIADGVSAEDKRYIEWAIGLARKSSRGSDTGIFDFIRKSMLAESDDGGASAAQVKRFARKVQQLTAPVMAKGVEDTSFYIYNRLVSLNDVGGDPATFGYGVNAFHGASADRAARWPHTMLATSTHDNKRSEDTRARIDVLSEMPEDWHQYLRRWSRMNLAKKHEVDGELAPSRNDEYLLYQTLIGSLPDADTAASDLDNYRERIEQYMLKAIREAKVRTSWVDTNAAYEAAVVEFARSLLAATKRNLFLDELREVVRTIGWLGMLNSLSMTLLKLTSPGVPDIYQGNELWDLSLADPDNRRAVDFDKRRRLLEELEGAGMEALFSGAGDGRLKMFTVQKLLALRKEKSPLFLRGGYTALQVSGERAAHVVAFARRHQGAGVIAVAGRLFATMGVQPGEVPRGTDAWRDGRIELPFLSEGTTLRDALGGAIFEVRDGVVDLADVFAVAPVAALVYAEGEK
ncbi:MAG: malto-oligosyltrehalose synthase [Betaproteobacteria bacterium]